MSLPSHSPDRVLNVALCAFGHCTVEILKSELRFQLGLTGEAADAAIQRWASNPSIRWDSFSETYFRPGWGGA